MEFETGKKYVFTKQEENLFQRGDKFYRLVSPDDAVMSPLEKDQYVFLGSEMEEADVISLPDESWENHGHCIKITTGDYKGLVCDKVRDVENGLLVSFFGVIGSDIVKKVFLLSSAPVKA